MFVKMLSDSEKKKENTLLSTRRCWSFDEEKYRESFKDSQKSYFPAKSLTEETETPQMISEEVSAEGSYWILMDSYLRALQITTK